MYSKIDYENSLIRLECCRDNLDLLISACESENVFLANAIHCVEFELIELYKEFSLYLYGMEDELDTLVA